MSLRWRLALLFAGGVVLATTAVAAAAVWSTSRSLKTEIDTFLRTRADQSERLRIPDLPGPGPLVVEAFGTTPRFIGAGGAGRPPLLPNTDSIVQVNRPDGSLAVILADTPELPVAESIGLSEVRTVDLDAGSYRVIAFETTNGYQVQIGRDLFETEAVLIRLRGQITIIGLGLAVVAGLAGWVAARRVATPLADLSRAADHVATSGDLSTGIHIDGRDEVARLGASFNTMIDALASSRSQQRRLVQDASHELRTPLTSLRTNIEVLQKGSGLSGPERRAIMSDVDAELRELSDLVTELVELATDTDRSDEAAETVDLRSLAEAVADRARRRTGRTIELDGGRTEVVVRPAMVERAISNLVDNADKWSPADESIAISITGRRLSVLDRGPGIESKDLSRIFERFYRSEVARAKPGSGLGLAIVAHIIEAHGGEVFALNRPGGGSEVGFELGA